MPRSPLSFPPKLLNGAFSCSGQREFSAALSPSAAKPSEAEKSFQGESAAENFLHNQRLHLAQQLPVLPPCSGIAGLEKIASSASCKAVAVLYARNNSVYKKFAACDVFDLARDARSYTGTLPVIAHPPCRLWGRLRQFSTAPVAEKELAFHAVDMVRRNGGVLEHPSFSTLWSAAGLPLPGVCDSFGGFTYPILQSWFGHKAPKATWLYVVGIDPAQLPSIPFELGIPAGRICKTGSRKVREGTPLDLAYWLLDVAVRVKAAKTDFRPASGITGSKKTAQIESCVVLDVQKLQKSLFDQAFLDFDLDQLSQVRVLCNTRTKSVTAEK